MAATTKVLHREPATPAEQSFLPEIVKGLGVTARHFFDNVFGRKEVVTVEYPDQTVDYPARYRGLHRLMTRDDGRVRCVACMMCPTVCPAHCITIVPQEVSDAGVEKAPAVFEIDELRCVVCGLCVEACPCDAIRMDTGIHMPAVDSRAAAVLSKFDLLKNAAQSTAVQGGVPDFRSDVP
jgi:NADH-quinone oxidoreductase subunit I